MKKITRPLAVLCIPALVACDATGVDQVPATVILIAPDTLSVRQPVILRAVVKDSRGAAMPDAELIWSSTDPTVAAVDGAGALVGVSEGNTLVIATASSAADTVAVAVARSILFATTPEDSEYLDLFTTTRHGTARRRLTDYEYTDMAGAWSPARDRIAFWSSRTESGVILLMNAEGEGVREIATGLATAYDFAWSPNGGRIAFAGRTEGAADDIYVIDPDGANLTRLTTDELHESGPAWSPDGTRIAFARNANIHVMKADGTEVVNLTPSLTTEIAPVWSPDGLEIAYAGSTTTGDRDVIHRMDADGGNLRAVGAHQVIQFDWSPEGDLFVFSTDVDGQRDIFTMPVDGGPLTRVTNSPAFEQDVRWR